MTYEEKFDIVVKAIKEAQKMTSSGYDTKLKITHENRLQELDLDDISSILFQLDKEHKVIKMISTANAKFLTGLDPWSEEQDYYALDILEAFQEWYGNYLLDQQATAKKSQNKNEVMYQIIYTKQRQVLMNNAQISKPDFNSENDLVFSFLYKNPNKRLTIEEIEKAIGGKLTKSLHKIVENLGFEGDTKKVFFSVSKTAIEFRNPIKNKNLEEMKKPLIKLVKGGGKLVIPH